MTTNAYLLSKMTTNAPRHSHHRQRRRRSMETSTTTGQSSTTNTSSSRSSSRPQQEEIEWAPPPLKASKSKSHSTNTTSSSTKNLDEEATQPLPLQKHHQQVLNSMDLTVDQEGFLVPRRKLTDYEDESKVYPQEDDSISVPYCKLMQDDVLGKSTSTMTTEAETTTKYTFDGSGMMTMQPLENSMMMGSGEWVVEDLFAQKQLDLFGSFAVEEEEDPEIASTPQHHYAKDDLSLLETPQPKAPVRKLMLPKMAAISPLPDTPHSAKQRRHRRSRPPSSGKPPSKPRSMPSKITRSPTKQHRRATPERTAPERMPSQASTVAHSEVMMPMIPDNSPPPSPVAATQKPKSMPSLVCEKPKSMPNFFIPGITGESRTLQESTGSIDSTLIFPASKEPARNSKNRRASIDFAPLDRSSRLRGGSGQQPKSPSRPKSSSSGNRRAKSQDRKSATRRPKSQEHRRGSPPTKSSKRVGAVEKSPQKDDQQQRPPTPVKRKARLSNSRRLLNHHQQQHPGSPPPPGKAPQTPSSSRKKHHHHPVFPLTPSSRTATTMDSTFSGATNINSLGGTISNHHSNMHQSSENTPSDHFKSTPRLKMLPKYAADHMPQSHGFHSPSDHFQNTPVKPRSAGRLMLANAVGKLPWETEREEDESTAAGAVIVQTRRVLKSPPRRPHRRQMRRRSCDC